jgi:hypothetical protein
MTRNLWFITRTKANFFISDLKRRSSEDVLTPMEAFVIVSILWHVMWRCLHSEQHRAWWVWQIYLILWLGWYKHTSVLPSYLSSCSAVWMVNLWLLVSKLMETIILFRVDCSLGTVTCHLCGSSEIDVGWVRKMYQMWCWCLRYVPRPAFIS